MARFVGLLAEEMLDPKDVRQREVALVTLQLLWQRRPAQQLLAIDVRDLAQFMRKGWASKARGELRAQQHQGRNTPPLEGLERQQTAHAVADDDGVLAEAVDRGEDVVRVRFEGKGRGIGRLRVVVAKREKPHSASREVAEEPFPQPGSGELAVQEQKRLAARSAFGQPGFDVQPALRELDLVLADRPCGRDLGGHGNGPRGYVRHPDLRAV